MARNPDPKPGRWVLPLVVLGMVLFTWIWVNRLGVTEVDVASDTTSASTTTSAASAGPEEDEAPAEEETPPTTQLSPEIQVYLDNLAEDKQALAELSAAMNAANREWDNRTVSYSEAEDNMQAVSEQALVFSTAVEDHRPPDQMLGLVDAHQVALDRAAAAAQAAEDVLTGLRAPDDGELRRAALVEFRAAAASFDQAVEQIQEIILQGVER